MLANTVLRRRWALALGLLAAGGAAPARAQAPWASMPGAPNFDYSVLLGYSPGSGGQLVTPAADVAWIAHYFFPMYRTQALLGQTTDNGQTWKDVQVAYSSYGSGIPLSGTRLVDYSALNAKVCWVLTVDANSSQSPYQTYLARTVSGVSGLAAISTALPTTARIIHFFSTSTGICLAGTTVVNNSSLLVYRTTDGGTTWTNTLPALPVTYAFTKYALGSHLWLTTVTGDVLHTPDEGLTWTVTPTGLGTKLGSVVFRDALHGLAYPRLYLNDTAPRQLARTADGGQSWQLLATLWPGNVAFITVQPGTGTYVGCANNSTDVYTTAGAVDTSSDEGNTWQTRFTDDIPYHELAMSPSGQLWALSGDNKDKKLPMLLRYVGAALASRPAAPLPVAQPYPNPTTGPAHLPPGETVRVYDTLGKLNACPAATGTLDFSAAPAGLYFLAVTSAAGATCTQRLAVVH